MCVYVFYVFSADKCMGERMNDFEVAENKLKKKLILGQKLLKNIEYFKNYKKKQSQRFEQKQIKKLTILKFKWSALLQSQSQSYRTPSAVCVPLRLHL